KHAEEIQREYEHNHAQGEDKVRIRELKSAPGYISPRAFKCDQQNRQRDEPCKNSNCERNAAAKNFLPTLSRLLDKAEHLERDHRQYARHQVQNEPAEKPKEQKGENSARRRWTARRKSRRTRDLPRRAIIAVRLLRKHHETRHRRQILRRRLKRNAKHNFPVVMRLNLGMANDRLLFRQRIEIECWILRQM